MPSRVQCRFVREMASTFFVGLHQVDVADPQRLRQLKERNDSRIAPPAFKAADILLAEA